MKSVLTTLAFLLLLAPIFAQKNGKINKNKQAVIASVDSKYKQLTDLSDKIWSYEEIAFQETQSAEALAQYAEANGF